MTAPRQMWVLAGARAWACEVARRYACDGMLWLGEPPAGAPGGAAREAHKWLGRELDLLVIDAWTGFDVEAFGAASGALRGGGLLLLLTPPLAGWPHYADPEYARIAVHPFKPEQVSGRFLARFVHLLQSHDIRVVTEADALPAWQATPGNHPANWHTADQQAALAAIMAMAQAAAPIPLVLTSDRGRGKSAVLGMAAAQLLRQGTHRIVVTAPRLAAVATLFEHAALRSAPDVSAGIRFVAPDELLHTLLGADLLLVDEAAAIPAPLLERLLAHYPRSVFATTLHGYEGTGRGFAVRFQRVLNERAPGWRSVHLMEPIRWPEHDPLERFVFDALLLDAQAADDAQLCGVVVDACSIERVERDVLLADDALLRQLFGLLVSAHYRTSPLDLRHLLDGPNVSVWLMRWQGQVAATALTVREGGFDEALAEQIYQGKRRPRGHLIPQSLALHSGFVAAPRLSGERIMRIAVHPAAQRRGLGTRLVQAIVKQAQDDGLDFVGSSFGASAELLAFWQRAAFVPVRLGLTREASSGAHSVIVLRPLSVAGEQLFAAVRARFLAHLPALLRDGMEEVDADVAAMLLLGAHADDGAELDAQDWRDVESFVQGWRGYEVCQVAVRKLVRAAIDQAVLDAVQRELLQHKVLLCEPWESVIAALGYSGRAQALAALRTAVAQCRNAAL
ncbi:tRNA(Met) cytidine acetyltransferase TmcA [Sulfurivermis fontis]|uniref:tRNA(Met) cytidine acetyltransferase TmcA n=1 Tax=Sulfurivermis fontis TaxID=1972068 RepID=UPI000FD6F758|nr:GNAT family N-acetyltransferase [Sulfurivermis fontis]